MQYSETVIQLLEKINLEKIKLYMAIVTPAGLFKELTNIVRNMEIVPMSFRGKKIETFVIPPSLGTFPYGSFLATESTNLGLS